MAILWHGLEVTLVLTVLSLILGSAIGVLVALMRTSSLRPFGRMKTSRLANFNPLASLGKIYVDIIRGTPLLVQLLIMYLRRFWVVSIYAEDFCGGGGVRDK